MPQHTRAASVRRIHNRGAHAARKVDCVQLVTEAVVGISEEHPITGRIEAHITYIVYRWCAGVEVGNLHAVAVGQIDLQ